MNKDIKFAFVRGITMQMSCGACGDKTDAVPQNNKNAKELQKGFAERHKKCKPRYQPPTDAARVVPTGDFVHYENKDGLAILRLPGSDTVKMLGRFEGDSIRLTKRYRTDHLLRAGRQYGFNYHLLADLRSRSESAIVYLTDDIASFKIPARVILDEGSFMQFKSASDGVQYELQIFLPLARIEAFRV